jgi:hypothetical protein
LAIAWVIFAEITPRLWRRGRLNRHGVKPLRLFGSEGRQRDGYHEGSRHRSGERC